MLVLSRFQDQQVVIGNDRTIHVELSEGDRKALAECDDLRLQDLAVRLLDAEPQAIVVTAVDVTGKARLGFDAPDALDVDRWEIYQIKEQKRLAEVE